MKADICTFDSDTIRKMKLYFKNITIKNKNGSEIIKEIKNKKGIGFYCFKRHEYIFIES